MQHDLTEISRLYNEEKFSQSQIANKVGVSRSRIQQLMRGMPKRTYAEASSNMNDQRSVTFNDDQLQLIYGSMLGDAGLYREVMKSNKTGNPIECYRLTFSHSAKQLRYLEHKKLIIGGSQIGERTSGHGSTVKYFSFCHTPTLRKLADIFHDSHHHKLVNEKWVGLLGWRAIAYWYMDDGCLIINRRRPMVEFHTESFNRDEVALLQDALLKRFSLATRTKKANGDDKQLVIVSQFRDQVGPFLESMSPFVLQHFNYKLRWLNDAQFAAPQCR